jgi:hypothetical protein
VGFATLRRFLVSLTNPQREFERRFRIANDQEGLEQEHFRIAWMTDPNATLVIARLDWRAPNVQQIISQCDVFF